MKNLTWQNPEQLFVAQELINKVKSKCCGIKGHYFAVNDSGVIKGIIVHPFWSDDYITDVLQQCNNAGIDKISIFELTRTMN